MHITRWIARISTLCVLGPIAARLAEGLHAPDGSEYASFLVSESATRGVVLLGMILAITIVSGVLIARLSTRREGMLNMAFILGWVAWTGGRMGELFRVEQGGFVLLAIEAAIIGAGVMLAMAASSKKTMDDDYTSWFDAKLLTMREGLMALGVALLVAVALAWVFGQTDLPGQSLWAALIGGIAAGLVGAMSQKSANDRSAVAEAGARLSGSLAVGLYRNSPRSPEQRRELDASMKANGSNMTPMIVGVMFAGVIAPLIGMVMPGSGGVLKAIGSGSLPGVLAVSPIAWSVGALIGVPIGWGWVESTVAMHEPQAKKA